jgi:hypothetical protein
LQFFGLWPTKLHFLAVVVAKLKFFNNLDMLAILEKGYQGIEKLRKNSLKPFKKPRNGEVTAEEKDITAGSQSLEPRLSMSTAALSS